MSYPITINHFDLFGRASLADLRAGLHNLQFGTPGPYAVRHHSTRLLFEFWSTPMTSPPYSFR